MSTDTSQAEQLVHDYTAWAQGDTTKADVIHEFVDVYNPGVPDGELHSRAAYAEYLRDIRSGLADFRFNEETIVAEGETIMVEFSITGTHAGELKGIPATDRDVAIPGVEKFTIEDGVITELVAYYDTREVPRQLGLTVPTIFTQLPKLAVRKVTR